jgi:hypothetical protein
VILPERNTNPEWEALLDRLDVATKEADQTALIAEAIKMMYPYEGRKMQIESIRAYCTVISIASMISFDA